MSVGIVMLVHTALGRVAEVARHFARSGCPVVIHADRNVSRDAFDGLVSTLSGERLVSFAARRHRCEWGMWGIVGATLDASAEILARNADIRHVYLASGACLPLRPVPELVSYLGDRPNTDFIESVTIGDVVWTKGGFDHDRFRLRFPVSFRRHRRMFDAATGAQRRLRLFRRLPEGLTPHLGSQWWCLSRATLEAILNDPERPALDRFFRQVWIPDESYFQSLVRRHGSQIESRSLTLSSFDHRGKPYTFYDDHLQLLRQSDCFVARKIWPGAERLYARFLAKGPSVARTAEPKPDRIERLFSHAIDRRKHGRTGLWMQSRYPAPHMDAARTAAPYSIFCGFTEVFDGFEAWLASVADLRVHGHLFSPDGAELAGGATTYNGGIAGAARLRDYNPHAFLTNLIWATPGERQCFMFGPADNQAVMPFVAGDPHAQVSIVSGAWALRLFAQHQAGEHSGQALRKRAASLQRVELEILQLMRASWVKARVRIWSLAEFLDAPMQHFDPILDEITPRAPRRPTLAPQLRSLDGFGAFLRQLRNEGTALHVAGTFDARARERPEVRAPFRPYLVR